MAASGGGNTCEPPNIYHSILENYGDKLVRLGDIATVRRGITTGGNDFFYLSQERVQEFAIEPEYCRRVMISPRESRSIAVDPDKLRFCVFSCSEDQETLEGTGALDYILWGEAKGYHGRTTMRSRRLWYDLGAPGPAQLAINTLVGSTARTFYSREPLLFDQTLYTIAVSAPLVLSTCVTMNSTYAQLAMNVGGHTNFGGGLLRIATYEVAALVVVDPALISGVDLTVLTDGDWDVLRPSTARRELDNAVFDVLGLTSGERDAVCEAVVELVGNRNVRALSTASGGRLAH